MCAMFEGRTSRSIDLEHRIRSLYPKVWATISDSAGKSVRVESLKSYLRCKKVANLNAEKLVVGKGDKVTDMQYERLLTAALSHTEQTRRRETVRKGVVDYARQRFADISRDTNIVATISPTPNATIEAALQQLTCIDASTTVYDLGCGDARWLCAIASTYRCKCVGVELVPEQIEAARRRATAAGVGDIVTIIEQDLRDVQLNGEASVVLMYLFPEALAAIAPKLAASRKTLKAIISVGFKLRWSEAPARVLKQGRCKFMFTNK